MNPYEMLGSGIGTSEASALSARLSLWHDAMVAHERRLQTGRTSDTCDDECPHAEARVLWSEAIATLGPRAHELTFLRLRAGEHHRHRATGDPAERDPDRPARTSRSRTARDGDLSTHRRVAAEF